MRLLGRKNELELRNTSLEIKEQSFLSARHKLSLGMITNFALESCYLAMQNV